VGFVVDKVVLGQVFSEYFGFPCQFSFHRVLYTHHLSSVAGAIFQLVADVPSGLSLTPSQETYKKVIGEHWFKTVLNWDLYWNKCTLYIKIQTFLKHCYVYSTLFIEITQSV
jgi:hypothetical protein